MKKRVLFFSILAVCILAYEFPTLLKHYATFRHEDSTLPTQNLPIDKPVTIYSNEYGVPYIHAKTDHDLAFALGLLHAKERLPQIELARILSQGNLSSIFGSKAKDADHTLRILEFGKAADQIVAMFPMHTLQWLEAYLQGLNYYIENTKNFPWDLKLMHLEPKPWNMNDLVTMFRMMSADVNWIYLASFIKEMNNPEWEKIWNLHMEFNQGSVPSNSEGMPSIQDLIHGFTESGSNSLVVGGKKTKSGAGMIASDPHISIFMPSLWFLCGMDSPSYHAVGMTVPGVPFISLGRNESIAWGATNMYSISSFLYELNNTDKLETRQENIPARFGKDSSVQIRDSKYGPVISDSPFFHTDKTFALHWLGHQPSDEITTFLKVQRAQNWTEFEKAFHGYSVLGLNYVFADRLGNIGYVPAYTQPLNKSGQKKLWYTTHEFSKDVIPESALSRVHNPKQGFIATSNNRPAKVSRDWGWFYAPNDRVLRQSMIMESLPTVTVSDLKHLQTDIRSISALQWIEWMDTYTNESVHKNPLFQKLLQWNGDYDQNKIEPLIYEFLIYDLSDDLLKKEFSNSKSIEKVKQSTFLREWTQKSLLKMRIDVRSEVVLRTFQRIKSKVSSYNHWGQFHQMKLQYIFGYIPWIGRAFELGTSPVSGSSDTLYKRAFHMNEKPTYVTYGSNARHISDLSDLDSNYFVIFGSQNGYPFSKNNTDQVDLWEKGEYMQLPLRLETVQKTFTNKIILQPK